MFGLGRRVLFVPMLLAAIGVPYALLENDWWPAAKNKVQALIKSPGGAAAADNLDTGGAVLKIPESLRDQASTDSNLPVEGLFCPIDDLGQILRFDITPTWVTQHWSRVTTVLGEMELQGQRVALVTGTRAHDLAGALTYYFDRQQRLQRITFFGHTGDTKQLEQFVTRQFSLQPEPSLGAGLYLVRWNGRPTSALRISHAPIVRSDSPLAKLEVQLELNRPEFHYRLSDSFSRTLFYDRDTMRWQP